MKGNGLIDGIIEEPLGGAHLDWEAMSLILKKRILSEIEELEKLSPQERIDGRIEKFCSMGVFEETV
jgi:acetyl-CoA carboxylase carboxyl transferase subunit alpha